MKKKYTEPAMQVYKLNSRIRILSGSNGNPSPADIPIG